MKFNEIEGNLIHLAHARKFDVIAHGCNCFCTMGAGIAPQMASSFGCHCYPLEDVLHKGDINKLGQIDYMTLYWLPEEVVNENYTKGSFTFRIKDFDPPPDHIASMAIVNAYTQYRYGSNHADGIAKPFDKDAFTLCMRKINHIFKGKHIGLPRIGAGLAGGNWLEIKEIIKTELKDCDVTIVTLPQN